MRGTQAFEHNIRGSQAQSGVLRCSANMLARTTEAFQVLVFIKVYDFFKLSCVLAPVNVATSNEDISNRQLLLLHRKMGNVLFHRNG